MAEKGSQPRKRRNKTRQDTVAVLQRRQYVFSLRVTGASYEMILQATQRRFGAELPLSYTRRSVCKDVLAEMKQRRDELEELVETVRILELDRLDKMLLADWAAALGRPADLTRGLEAVPPDLQAQDMVLKLMSRRARYLPGLEGPVKIAPTTPDGEKPYDPLAAITEDYTNEVAMILAEHGQIGLYGLESRNGSSAALDAP